MSTPVPDTTPGRGKTYMLIGATRGGGPMIQIMKPSAQSELIITGTCITFTEHTPTGDVTRRGKITSIQEFGDSVINYIDIDTNIANTIGIDVTTYRQNGNDWSTIKRIKCPSSEDLEDASFKAPEEASTKGGKRRRRTRQARRRKNRRTRSRK